MSLTNQLVLFVDVVQQGSFAKAAILRNMDNSLFSKQIKKLEQTLGVQLLNRSTRSISLTSAGEEILQQSYHLIDTLEDIKNIAGSYQSELRGSLRISSSVSFGQKHLQPIISQFIKKYPNVNISLQLDDKKTNLISEHFDLSFRIGKLEDSNLIARKIADTHFAFLASQVFIDRYGAPKTPHELMSLPAILYANGDVTIDLVEISTKPHGKELHTYRMKSNYRFNDMRVILNMVKDGLGYTLVDLSNLDQPLTDSGLIPLLGDHKLSTMDTAIYALYPHRKQTLLVQTFIDEVQSYIGKPAFWQNYIPDYDQLYR